MRNLFIALVIVFFTLLAIETVSSANVIYIAEPLIENGIEKTKTIINLYKPDGTELKKTLVNGIMARLSPDDKYIVYLEQRKYLTGEIAIADSDGRKIRNLPSFLHKSHKDYMATIKLGWSPDGSKIAVLQRSPGVAYRGGEIRGHLTILSILDLKTNEFKPIYETYAKDLEHTVQWFQNNAQILFTDEEGVKIIDIELKNAKEISKDSMVAHLSRDESKVIYISRDPSKKPPFYIRQYDFKKGNSEELLSLDIYPSDSVLSHDGRYLVFQIFPVKEPSVYIVDLLNKKINKMDTKDLFMIPKKFSYYENNLIICMALKISKQESEKAVIYGIFNLDSGKFQKLKETSNIENIKGEYGFLWLMGIDWYDWR